MPTPSAAFDDHLDRWLAEQALPWNRSNTR
jgi:hypothetical protein